ncbi:hypothetical protein NL676_035230 [Syzygium grande]|nr:hypothetical protein NL676_035230 [Syzygium grande]
MHRPDQDYELVTLSVEMSFNHKLRSPSSPCLLFCCFHDGHTAAAYHEARSSDDCDDGNRRKAVRSPRSVRCECWSLVARIGRCRRQGHVAASKFGYDPMSYALNFEDDRSRE